MPERSKSRAPTTMAGAAKIPSLRPHPSRAAERDAATTNDYRYASFRWAAAVRKMILSASSISKKILQLPTRIRQEGGSQSRRRAAEGTARGVLRRMG
jgi:hypothetical protein